MLELMGGPKIDVCSTFSIEIEKFALFDNFDWLRRLFCQFCQHIQIPRAIFVRVIPNLFVLSQCIAEIDEYDDYNSFE